MRLFVLEVAASIVASAIIYLVTGFLPPALRLIVMVLLLVLGTVAAWLAYRGEDAGEGQKTKIGQGIKSEGDVAVEQVEVKGPGSVQIGTELKSGGASRVRDIRVIRGEDPQ